MQPVLTLEKAQHHILIRTMVTGGETVTLVDSLARVPIRPLSSLVAQPGFDQSTFDGYAIPRQLPEAEDGCLKYHLIGEIAAGDINNRCLTPAKTYRIMTGGAIPQNCWKVLPQEICREVDGMVTVSREEVVNSRANMRMKGSEYRLGGLVAHAGLKLTPVDIARLADAGYQSIEVHRKPRVAFFCTGSELVDDPDRQQKGLKISSNRYLLDALIKSTGAEACGGGIVADDREAMCDHLGGLLASSMADIIISTGGMGPGKYDILEETFKRIGGEIVFNSLQLRPGRSTLFGILDGRLYFGLPGPPPAARALFYELVRPAILKAQGIISQGTTGIKAHLEHDLVLKKRGVLRLREGRVSLTKGTCSVRSVTAKEVPNCYLLFPSHRRVLRAGELVTVHCLESPFNIL